MSAFAYRAMDPRGRIVRGRVDAANLVDLELRLRRLDLDLVHGSPIQPRFWQTQKGASRRELIKFCFHLEQFLRAGVPIIESLTDLRDAIRRPHFRQVVAATVESIEGGLTLSQALAQHPTVFDGVFCSLIRAGEHTGRLPEVLHALSESLKRDDELAAYARRIVIYPAIVGLVILAALGVAVGQERGEQGHHGRQRLGTGAWEVRPPGRTVEKRGWGPIRPIEAPSSYSHCMSGLSESIIGAANSTLTASQPAKSVDFKPLNVPLWRSAVSFSASA